MATVPDEAATAAPTPAQAQSQAPAPAPTPDQPVVMTQFAMLSNQKKLGILVAIAAIIALLVGAWLWSQTPDYRILYSDVSDQDGGEVIAELQKMNIPYQFSPGGGAILIPADQVHEVRLKLAGQGLPKSALPGFELMENQKFGSSQFLEQVNYQRALEGELARSVQSISAVETARVHLAMAKPSVFARKKQQPRVSVLLNLYPGRVLTEEQVGAVVNLMSSSIPELPIKNVTVVDQHGNLLSGEKDDKKDMGFDDKQLEYIHKLEDRYTKRIEKILIPIMGKANVRAQVTADVDFSRVERAEEIFKPNNQKEDKASIRSQQTVESSSVGSNFDGGIPGALSNQPPEPAQAPIEVDTEAGAQANGQRVLPKKQRAESVINYEVDKTIQHTHQSMGNIKRLSAAVVINYRKMAQPVKKTEVAEEQEKEKADKAGDEKAEKTDEVEVTEETTETTETTEGAESQPTEAPSYEPLSAEELEKITELVKQAIGYSAARGDSLTVTNSLFTLEESPPVVEIPFWKDPDTVLLAKDIGKQLLIAGLVLFFLLKIVRPFFVKLMELKKPVEELPKKKIRLEEDDEDDEAALEEARRKKMEAARALAEQELNKSNLQVAKQMALEEPAIVANVVRDWVSGNNNG